MRRNEWGLFQPLRFYVVGGSGHARIFIHLTMRADVGLTLSVATVDAVSPGGGTARIQGGWLVLQPPAGMHATDPFTYTITDGTRQATGSIALVVDPAPDTVTQNITATVLADPGGGEQLHLTAAGIPGRTYRLQTTPSLVPPVVWSDLGPPVTAATSGRLGLVDSAPAAPRFYRVVGSDVP